MSNVSAGDGSGRQWMKVVGRGGEWSAGEGSGRQGGRGGSWPAPQDSADGNFEEQLRSGVTVQPIHGY